MSSNKSLIQELLRMRAPDAEIDPGSNGLYNTGIDRAIAIIRQHEADPTHTQSLNTSPERVQTVERIEHDQSQDVVELVARAIYDAEPEPEKPFSQWWDWKSHAKAAIAAMDYAAEINAPRVTEREAVEILTLAFHTTYLSERHAAEGIAALRASGVRFKDSRDGET